MNERLRSILIAYLVIVLVSCKHKPELGSPEQSLAATSSEQQAQVDLQLVAEYRPGKGPGNRSRWTVVINGQGSASLENHGTGELSKRDLTSDEISSLAGIVDDVQFMHLDLVEQGVVDVSSLTLHVIRGGRFHSEHVMVTPDLSADPEVERFLRVWRKVVALVPSPDTGL